jgi:adenylate cyclase
MGIEIERKFLVQGEEWRSLGVGTLYRQGYVVLGIGKTVRVRVAGHTGYLTIKGPSRNLTRSEFEYEIPLADAMAMLDSLCEQPLVEKMRYKIPYAGLTWEVDEFSGENQGLILAEVELTTADQAIALPPWIGQEVSHDRRYYNSYLVRNPFRQWPIEPFSTP